MNITPETKPINEIFSIEGKHRYTIPSYQRNYSWSPDNIDELFNDILHGDPGYYIGNILVTSEEKINAVSVFSVVDGQQRMTTIALFFLAIYEKLSRYDGISDNLVNEESIDIDVLKRIGSIQENIKSKLRFSDKSSKLVLLGEDQKIYNDLLTIMDKKTPKAYGNRIFPKRYKYICELVNDNFENFENLNLFYENLNLVELLRITVQDISDAFTIFSSINAKGMPLTLIDLMKANYMGNSIGHGISEEIVEIKWEKLVKVLTLDNSSPNSNLITQFLLNNYDTFQGNHTSSLTRNLALKKYQEIFKDDVNANYIDELTENAMIFSYISPNTVGHDDFQLSESIISNLDKLKKLDSSQAYPLVMFLLKQLNNQTLDEKVVCESINILINFFVRRNISQKPKSSNIRAKILDIIKTISLQDSSYYLETIREKLLSISVSDEEFKLSLMEGVYDVSPSTVRFILIHLERKFGGFFNKQTKDTLDDTYINKKNKQSLIWTIEHILPSNQKLSNGWDIMLSPTNIAYSPLLHSENVHKLGNLTLSGYNSELGDKSFLDKRDLNFDQKGAKFESNRGLRTPLFLNLSIPDEEETIENKTVWNVDDIKRRTKYFTKLIIDEFKI